MTKITLKQQTVLDYVQEYLTANHRGPLLREIQAACQIVSYKSVLDRLIALERKGLIKRLPNKHRGIRLAHRPHARPKPDVPSEVLVGEGGI